MCKKTVPDFNYNMMCMGGLTPGFLHTSPEQKFDTCACGTPEYIESRELCNDALATKQFCFR